MAKATAKHGKPVLESITLELTPTEAQHLYSLSGFHIIGTGPARKTFNAIYHALSDNGLEAKRLTLNEVGGTTRHLHLKADDEW